MFPPENESPQQGFGDISPQKIRSLIRGVIGRDIRFFHSVASTNVIALDMAGNVQEGTVVIAESQEHGRGRHGRSWESPPGVNIYMSIILKPVLAPKDAMVMTLMAAVASAAALREHTGIDVTIKWPNDLLVHDKKVGGILTEMKTEGGRVTCAIIGIGINVNSDLSDFPEEIQTAATSVKSELGISVRRTEVVAGILNELDRWYRVLCTKGGERILTEWKRLSTTLGKKVMVTVGESTYCGVAESVDETGMLVLRLFNGERRILHAGDLTHLRDDTAGTP
jgi:BirA family biotin operon repressor/biotin-[acetyl-CoA-carboxylase] ligase